MKAVERFDPDRGPMPCGGSGPQSKSTSCVHTPW
jgi:hypothetical protein